MFALAAIAWVGFEAPPGGRWVVVHLFTLGVVTPLIVAFSQHQAETILRVPGRSRVWLRTLLTTGALLLLGMVTDVRASVAVLALVLTALPGVWATSARIAAGVALAVTAFGAVNVVVPLLRTVKRKGPGAPAPGVLLAAATTWLALGIGMDAVVVLAGAWRG